MCAFVFCVTEATLPDQGVSEHNSEFGRQGFVEGYLDDPCVAYRVDEDGRVVRVSSRAEEPIPDEPRGPHTLWERVMAWFFGVFLLVIAFLFAHMHTEAVHGDEWIKTRAGMWKRVCSWFQ